MPKIVRSARGEVVDFDAVIIKQQIARAPMAIDVARRKAFIDAKNKKARANEKSFIEALSETAPDPSTVIIPKTTTPTHSSTEFDVDVPVTKTKGTIEAVPNLPERKRG